MPNPELDLRVDCFYVNVAGLLVKLVKRKVRPRSWTDKSFDHYFVDQSGQRYLPNGIALKGSQGGLLPRVMRSITDRAQEVQIGEIYEYYWADKASVGVYTVIDISSKGYKARWDNDFKVETDIRWGCPLNYDAVKIN